MASHPLRGFDWRPASMKQASWQEEGHRSPTPTPTPACVLKRPPQMSIRAFQEGGWTADRAGESLQGRKGNGLFITALGATATHVCVQTQRTVDALLGYPQRGRWCWNRPPIAASFLCIPCL